ncbi:hypothetical protein L7F22_027484 [Adiantum nelumboides]|nr:hypothetical protein [Adiantum nelumboides]
MPIDWVQEHKAIPKKKDQVKVEDIQNYDYWIIDGQHSISCAKMLVTTNDLDEALVHLKDAYRYQKAWIIVDAPMAISKIQQWKPPKAGGKSKLTPKKPRKRVSLTLDTTEAKAGPSNLGLLNSKRLVKMAKKAKDSPLGEISQYADFFPLGLYREFEIPVAKCFLAPEHIMCRSMSEDKLEIILGWFTSKANNPASCAYLMPIDWVQEHKAIPKKKDQVKVEDIQNYDYWIIDGQHSISCAKMLVTTNDLDEGLVHLKDAYRYQKARIIVDAPTQLDDAVDVQNITNSDRYGQLPVLYGHELFNLVSDVIEYWKEPNAEWSQKTLHLGKLPPAKQVQDIIDTKSSSTTSIDTRNTKSTTRASQGIDTLQDKRKEGPLVPHMKPSELISLAKRLGCEGANLKSQFAKAFINRFLNEHGLLDINKFTQTYASCSKEMERILTKEPEHDQQVAHDVDNFQKEMQEVVDLMNNLSVHMMGGERGQGYGYGRGYGSNEGFAGGRGRDMAGRGDMFQCYNCGEWSHKSPQCDKPKRMGGDMFCLPSQIPSRAQDYGKDGVDAMVMPMSKRTTREQDTSDAGPSHKRGKQAETCIGKEKKKRKPRRHYNTSDFPLGEGQPDYNIRADLVGEKADVTFGQLMQMWPRLKGQWKRMVNPMKNEPTKGSVKVLSLNELPDICPNIDAWHKRKCIGEACIDGGAQDWGHGTIILYNRSGDKKKFDMATKQSLDTDFDEVNDDEEYLSEEEDDGEESSELDDSSGDSDVKVSSLFLEEEKGQKQAALFLMENEDTSGPYEQI